AERIETDLVEIGGAEFLARAGGKAPGPIVEALAGNVDIVAVEHAMDEAGCDVACSQGRGRRAGPIKQARSIFGVVADWFVQQMLQAIAGQLRDAFGIVKEGKALKIADADMAMAEG